MSVLDRAAVERVDPSGMVADVLDQPAQLDDALWRAESARLPREDASILLVCGMGGSGVGAELAAAALGPRATRPLVANHGYGIPGWVGEDTVVLCASYSGDTEETLECFEAAGRAGARRIALTTGGRLAEAARAHDVPVIGAPAGFQPRAAVAYQVVGVLECAAAAGVGPRLSDEISAAARSLEARVAEWGPEGPDDGMAKRLARSLHGSVPIIHGAEGTTAVAARWKTQVNENAKSPAFASVVPEANHNEICGWDSTSDLGRLSAVFLEDSDQHPRVRRRIEVTADAAASGATAVERVNVDGASRVERLLSLVLLGDLMSVYLAVLDGTDPTPVEAIGRLKSALG